MSNPEDLVAIRDPQDELAMVELTRREWDAVQIAIKVAWGEVSVRSEK